MKLGAGHVGCGLAALLLALTFGISAAKAQESTGALMQRGLDLSRLDPARVALVAQAITISPQTIAIEYQLSNPTEKSVSAALVLPLPDLEFSDPDADWMIPGSDPLNFMDVTATIDHKPASFSFKQTAHVGTKDVSPTLRQQGLALAPLARFRDQLAQLSREARADLENSGVIARFGTDRQGNPHFFPGWTTRTTATRNLILAPGQTIAIELRYRTSVGVARDSPLREPLRSQKEFAQEVERRQSEYCADRAFFGGIDKIVASALAEKAKAIEAAPATGGGLADILGSTPPTPAAPPSVRVFPLANEANIREWRIAYDLAAGAPAAPIRDFRLVVDKGRPDRIASFCLDNFKRISPTAFELRATEFTPANALQILVIGRE